LNEINFNSIVDKTITLWKQQSETLLFDIFLGQDNKLLDLLETLTKDGRLTSGSHNGNAIADISAFNNTVTQGRGRRAFYAIAIPTVWMETGQYPAVVDSGPCSGSGKVEISDHEYDFYCYNGRGYSLVAAPGDTRGRQCIPPPVVTTQPCRLTPLRYPAGSYLLDGEDWGGVTREDIIAG